MPVKGSQFTDKWADTKLPLTALYMYHRAYPGPITVCLLVDAAGDVVSRGVAVCSVIDQFVKAIGREIAFGRALKAAQTQTVLGNPVGRKPNMNLRALQDECGTDSFDYLSIWLPHLIPFEDRVVASFNKGAENRVGKADANP